MSTTIDIEVIRKIAADALEVEPARITDQTNFVLDLGVDSLAITELLARLESELHISIVPEALVRMVSLDTVAEVVEETLARVAA
jgi:acyl carrier protein